VQFYFYVMFAVLMKFDDRTGAEHLVTSTVVRKGEFWLGSW